MTALENSRDPDPNNNKTIYSAVVLAVIGPIFFLLQPIYAGALTDTLGFNAQEIGWLIGAEISGTAIASVSAFFCIRRLNWRAVVLFGLAAQAICNLASCFVTGYLELLMLRLVTAVLGMGPIYIVAVAMLSATERTGRNFSLVVFGQMTLAIAGMAIVPQFIPDYGLAALFVPVAVIGILACGVARYIPQQAAVRLEQSIPDYARENSAPAIGVLWIQGFWYLGIAGVWTFIERIGVGQGIPAIDVSGALAIGMAVGLAGAISSGYLIERFGRLLPFTVGMVFQVVAIALLFEGRGYTGFLLVICLYNVMWNISIPPIFELMAAADGQGRFAVILPTAQAVALLVGAIMGGILVHDYGLMAVLVSGILFTTVALLLFAGISIRLDRSV